MPFSMLMAVYLNKGQIAHELEDLFLKIVDRIKSENNEEYLKDILKMKTNIGDTCIAVASRCASPRIFKYLMSLDLPVDGVRSDGEGISYSHADDIDRQILLLTGANPYVREFKYNKCQAEDYNSSKLTNQTAYLNMHGKELHFSIEPSDCGKNCLSNCADKLPAFAIKNGRKVSQIRVIGQGGFGTVIQGQLHGEMVAVKEIKLQNTIYIPPLVTSTLRCATGMSKEALDLKGISHKHILTVNEYWFQQTTGERYFCFAAELLSCNLSEYISTCPGYNHDEMQKIALQMCSALDYIAGRGLAHLDIKPKNILLLMEHGKIKTSKLGDFGLLGRAGGTPLYCSPEQLSDAEIEKSDVFGFGVTILKMVCNKDVSLVMLSLPITQTTLRNDILKNLPILMIIEKMLRVNPDDRPTFKQVESILTNQFPKVEITQQELQNQTKHNISDLFDPIADRIISMIDSEFPW